MRCSKQFCSAVLLLLFTGAVKAQQLSLGNTPYMMNKSAVLELNSANQGLLLPRISDTASINTFNPPDGMVIYYTPSKQLLIRSAGYWNPVTVNAENIANWSTSGNTGITASKFLGTTDDKALILKSANSSYVEMGRRQTLGLVQAYTDYTDVNEQVIHLKAALQFNTPSALFYKPKMFVDAAGNFRAKGSSAGTDFFEFGSVGTNNDGGFEFIVGDDGNEPIVFKSNHYQNGTTEMMRLQSGRMAVGSNAFNATNPEKLLIDAGNTASYNLMTGKGSIDNYLQINVQNKSATANASSDIVATADNGDENGKYIDMGINSSAFSNPAYPIIGGANNTYLYGTGNDFVIGNATANQSLRLFTGGYALTNERLRIDGSGKVGIANTAPSEMLDLTGNLKFSGALMPGGSAGTAGYLLQSNGAGLAPSWITSTSAVSSTAWMQDGNTLSAEKKFGTITSHALPFITNNTERMRIAADGRVSIGGGLSDNFSFVEVRKTLLNNIDSVLLTLNSNNGGENAGPSLQYKNTGAGYMGAIAGIDDGAFNGRLEFRTNGTGGSTRTTPLTASDNKMVLKSNGNLGIGTVSPSERLDVTGNLKFSGALMPAGTAGTLGYVLTSSGAGAAPTWQDGSLYVTNNAWIHGGNNLASIKNFGTTTNHALPFITNNTERMRLGANGYLGLGTDAAAGRFHAVSDNSETGDDYLFDDYSNATNPGFFFRRGRGTVAAPLNLQSGDLIHGLSFIPRINGSMAYNPGSAIDAYYLGTGTDNKTDLRLSTSGTEKVRIDEEGNVGIGSSAFDGTSPEKLLVDAGTGTYTPILAKGNVNSYFQINIKNASTGNQSSSDLVATANNGTETTNFVNLGINGSNFLYQTGNPIETGKANDGYLISAGNDFYIVNNNAAKDIIFTAGGTAPANEAMRITSAEKIGIGTTTPSERFHVVLPTATGTTQTPVATVETINTTTTASSMPPVFSLLRQVPSFAGSTNYSGPVLSFGFRTGVTANSVAQMQVMSLPSTSRLSFYSRTGMTNANPATGTLAENMYLDGTALNVKNLAGGATSLSVDANGNIIRTPSDAKLKRNIETIESPLSKIMKLRGVSYNWIDTATMGNKKELGFIAQELEKVVPEVVSSGGEYKSVNYQVLTALLTEGMKEQQKEIDSLKKDMQELKEELLRMKKERSTSASAANKE